MLAAAALLSACGPSETPTPCPTAEPTECPECPECPEQVVEDVPFADAWAASGHADAEAEAFTHWDEDDPPEVPVACAKCHSEPGYLDFLGLDGTEAGTVDNAAEIGTVVTCQVCHNEGTAQMTSVTFPSGIEVTGLGDEARCMQCHQGRASTATVNDAIAEVGVDADTPSEDMGFVNIHYYAAAATQYGTMAQGGYEYEGKSYDARFAHVEQASTCFECHDAHSLELDLEACAECHTEVSDKASLKDIRSKGSTVDYDGDGNVDEGLYYEIEGLQEVLYGAMQTYASDVAGTPIVYDSAAYPYFFIDTNENGEADEDEANYGNQYNAWTPRLLKAAYNYQTSLKDPGSYAHGGNYIIELLYDSIEDLDAALVEGLQRTDVGHFDGSSEAFRHWDEDGAVAGACAKCHSADGLPFYLHEDVNISQPVSNGFECSTCHDAVPGYSVYEIEQVAFPSGAMLTSENTDNNLCLNCHQGRESTVSVRAATADMDADTVSEELGFLNVHYFAAGATLFGTEAQGAYEYEGQTYLGQTTHPEEVNECTECHTAHGLEVDLQSCSVCHSGVESIEDARAIRSDESTGDYDGDGDTEEGIAGEIDTLRESLYAAIQAYAAEVPGTALVYDSHAYPYFFIDTNENGEADPDEANYGNQYNAWTPRLLKAAYNYQYAAKDPGAYTHNPKYIIQVLHDSLVDMGNWAPVDTGALTRPAVE
jgi:hypothetical protein